MTYSSLQAAFEELSPRDKGLFIGARLAWAPGSLLCLELFTRLCHPTADELPTSDALPQ